MAADEVKRAQGEQLNAAREAGLMNGSALRAEGCAMRSVPETSPAPASPIMVMSYDFELLGELPHYISLSIKRELWGTGSFKLTVASARDGFGPLARDRVLYMPARPHVAMLVTRVSKAGGKITADGTLLKGLAKRRIALPPLRATEAPPYGCFGYDLFTGDAESAYLHYAGNNLITPEDEKRRMPRMVAAENRRRGSILPWQARFDRLSELFASIGEATGMGWDVWPDFAAKQYVFGVIEGVDRTSGASRAALSREMGNADAPTMTDDATAAATTIYAGGAGEDEGRLILSFGNEDAGVNRYELFVDCGSASDADMLGMAAERKRVKPARTLTLSVTDGGLCRYERDYDVGDKMTCIAEDWRMDAQLIAMDETWENGKRSLKATFGDAPVTAAGMLKKSGWQMVR